MSNDKAGIYQRVLFTVFWVIATFGFVNDEILPFISSLRSPLFFLLDFTIVGLGLLTMRESRWAMVSIGIFTLLSLLVTVILNGYSLLFYINGYREFVGIAYFFPIMRYFNNTEERRARFVRAFDKNLYIFLVIQALCITFQFFKYGAGDQGGGSFGNNYSGVVSLSIYAVSFYLMQKRVDRNDFFNSLWANKSLIFLLYPTFLNETKVSFLLLPLYFFLLMPIDRKMFMRIVVTVPIVAVVFLLGDIVYSSQESGKNDFLSKEYLTEYLIGDIEDPEGDAQYNLEENSATDLPRYLKFVLMQQLDAEHPGHVLTGFGVGQFKGGSHMERSSLADEYDWLFFGTMPYALHVYIQLGVLGLLWMVFNFWVMFTEHPAGYGRRNKNLQLFFVLVVLIVLVYNEAFRGPEFSFFFASILATSWLKTEPAAASQSTPVLKPA